MAARTGRGRLSAIQLLPAEATPVIAWANEELRRTTTTGRTQLDIYQEFHARLEVVLRDHRGEVDFVIPSFSAFNRHSIKLAALTRRLDATREISAALADKFDGKASDDLTIIAAEAIKSLVFEVVTATADGGGVDPKDALHLASALFKAAQAQGVSTARRARVEKEFAADVGEAIEKVKKATGMSSETAEQIKAQILGVNKA